MRLTFVLYSSGVMAPQHAPGPRPTCASKHGRASRASSASGSFSRRRLSPRQSAHDVAHSGTTRRAMSTMSRAARLSV